MIGKALDRGQQLKTVGAKLGELNGLVKELDGWLNDAVGILKREDINNTPQAFKDTVQALFNKKMDRATVTGTGEIVSQRTNRQRLHWRQECS